MIDVNRIRDAAISLHGLDRADEVYTIYYDETNNIRRLRVTPKGLNVQEPGCYVLGGIAHKGSPRDLGVGTLKSHLKIQKSVYEIKLKHIGKGNFIDLLGSTKIAMFLEWVLSEGLFIHYQVLDPIYWSIVDVVDSILTELENDSLLVCAPILKNDLYVILRYNFNCTIQLFQRYSYPDVGRDRRRPFVSELNHLLEERHYLLERFNYQMLKGVLEAAVNLESLPYLEDEKPNVLLDGFCMFYVNNICLFKNSAHIMDIEEVIEENLKSLTFMDDGRPLKNYGFVDSMHERGIQVADIVVGLLGKFFTFTNSTELYELSLIRSSLSATQRGTLSQFREVVNSAVSENPAFANRVLSLDDNGKAAFFLGS